MPKGSGGGKTPIKLVELLNDAIDAKGQSTVERETGLSHSMISRYKRGIGEPTTETLKKLADYFKMSVESLRGRQSSDPEEDSDLFIKILSCLLEIYEIIPERLKETLKVVIEGYRDEADNTDFTKIPCEKYKQLDALTSKAWDIFYGDAEFDADGVLLGRNKEKE